LTEWTFAQHDPSELLCHLHHFAVTKKQPSGDVEFIITVKEYVTPPDPAMKFIAQADKQTNQSKAPYTPIGWGTTLMVALAECIRAIHKFPYEG
jgi:hypothetical protein